MAVDEAGQKGQPFGVDGDGVARRGQAIASACASDPTIFDDDHGVARYLTGGGVEQGVAEDGADHEPMLSRNLTAADRVLAVVSIALSIAACLVIAVGFGVPVLSLLFPGRQFAAWLVLVGPNIALWAPGMVVGAIVCGHISRKLYPEVALGRFALILAYAILGLMVLFGIVAVATLFTIRTP